MNWNKIGGKKEPKFDTPYLLQCSDQLRIGTLSGIKSYGGDKCFLFLESSTDVEFQATHFCEIKPPKD